MDRWLNAQRGWRRLLICWLALAPALVDTGLVWSGWGNGQGRATVPTGSVLVHVAIAALAGIPLAALSAVLHRRRQKSRPWAPGLSWRMIAALYVIIIPQCVTSYGDARTWTWQYKHLPHAALFLTVAAGLVLLFWHASYSDKVVRQAKARARAAAQRNEQGVAGD